MAGDDVPDAEHLGTAVEGLAAEDAAVGTVALLPDGLDDLVHGPAVELVVADNPERQAVLRRVSPHCLEGVISVALDALVYAQENEVEAIPVPVIQGLEDGGQDCRILTAGGTDGDLLAGPKEVGRLDGVVDLIFED